MTDPDTHLPDTSVLAQALSELQNQNAEQLKLMKKQLQLFRFLALFLAIALAVLAVFLGSTFNKVNRTIEHIETVTADLAKADWTGMVENINILVESSQESLGQATAKIDSIDIETLNQSIQDLNTVIGPIARLFGG
ncbi:MAG: hypothetical protein PHQ83_12950 [Eubacteriales bacterium]|nr:hypothetical protein [Eubacteriales bacterium]